MGSGRSGCDGWDGMGVAVVWVRVRQSAYWMDDCRIASSQYPMNERARIANECLQQQRPTIVISSLCKTWPIA
ncbi:Protein of unknown function [Pyronema omphalodes CBS 100304]|uniref:Uncharacterized protein n=1 Tax=Pyronema omphalodes (strain CBS 100304) TaxID=1076935 RepID=U4L865_PYROM|nr:Protein of unknown function [Pyronema omphalodes CBS 100304]